MLEELRTFIAVAKCGSFAAAASKVGLTQSAVSGQIRRLEASLGMPLFDRTGRSVVLNEVGHRILARAEEVVALYSRIGETAQEKPTRVTLRIGLITSFAQSPMLGRILKIHQEAFPDSELKLLLGPSLYLMDQLEAGGLDLAVVVRPPFDMPPDIGWKLLSKEPFVVLAPKSARTSDWRQILRSYPFLRYDRKSFGGRRIERFLHAEKITVRDFVELDDIQGLICMVSSGLGVTVVPATEAYRPFPTSVRMISLDKAVFYREVGIILRRRIATRPDIAQFLRCLELGVASSDATS